MRRILQFFSVHMLISVLFCLDCRSEKIESTEHFEGWLGAEMDVRAAFDDARYVYEGLIIKVQTNGLTVKVKENFKRITDGTIDLTLFPPSMKWDNLVVCDVSDRVIIFSGRFGMVSHSHAVFKLLPATDETQKRMRSLAEKAGPIKEVWLGEEISPTEAFDKADAVYEVSVEYFGESERWRGFPPWRYDIVTEINERFKTHEEAIERNFYIRFIGNREMIVLPRRNQNVIIFMDPNSPNLIFKMMDATDETRALMRKLRDSNNGEKLGSSVWGNCVGGKLGKLGTRLNIQHID